MVCGVLPGAGLRPWSFTHRGEALALRFVNLVKTLVSLKEHATLQVLWPHGGCPAPPATLKTPQMFPASTMKKWGVVDSAGIHYKLLNT